MPFFTYACTDCGYRWDERRDRNDPDLDQSEDMCPGCGEYFGRRVFMAYNPPVYFHGRGWSRVDKNYKNDGSD